MYLTAKLVGNYFYVNQFQNDPFMASYFAPLLPQKQSTAVCDRDYSLYRARKTVRELIEANSFQYLSEANKPIPPLFTTLTFRDNVTDLQFANYEFTKFIQRLNYNIYNSKAATLKYVATIEFQRRGAVHYHSLLFNVPFLTDIYNNFRQLWGNGSVNIHALNPRQIDKTIDYITKYMLKKNKDPRLENEKTYLTSNNLHRATKSKDPQTIKSLIPYAKKKSVCEFKLEHNYIKQEKYFIPQRYQPLFTFALNSPTPTK